MAEPVRTIDEFLEVARKSDLLEAGRLEAVAADWPDRSQPLPEELVRRLVETELLTQWQADQLRKGRSKGFKLGKYKLLRLLGAGGMSSVYLAENTSLHRKVAIKVLPVKRIDQGSYLARFEREAQAAFRLRHQNIAGAIDLDASDSIHFIVMEYVEGTDLHAKVKAEGPLPLREAVDAVRQAAVGLHYAHEEGFVHRDVKPANLILDKRGTVKILDLGLAFAAGENDDSLTIAHSEKVLGTADYLAPEQAKDSHLADARSDIYALGCTLYFLLVGRPPFATGTLAERIQAHLRQPPPRLLDARPDAPAAIADLYDRMLEKHPDARPQTAKEIAESLDAWLKSAGQTVSQPRRGLPERINPGDSGIRAAASARASGSDVLRPAARQGSPKFPPAAPRPAGSGRPGSGSGFGKAGKQTAPATPDQADKPKATSRALPRNVLGMPLGLWLMGLGLLVLAGVLAYFVLGKSKAKKGRKTAVPAAAAPQAAGAPEADPAAQEQQPPAADAGAAEASPAPAAERVPKKPRPAKVPAGKSATAKKDDQPRPRGPLDDAVEQPAAADGKPEPPAEAKP